MVYLMANLKQRNEKKEKSTGYKKKKYEMQ